MINIEEVEVFGFDAAIRGMRNPLNSWDKSDSGWCSTTLDCVMHTEVCDCGGYCVGKNDLKLMKSLSKAGNDHAKFLRMINVTVDITAPLYWWKEYDTYKVGTVANSCSTMHKIHDKELTRDDFSWEHLYSPYDAEDLGSAEISEYILNILNRYRKRYLYSKNKKDWQQMIQLLPSSYNQRRTVQLNYQVLKSMYFARKNHKLDEWVEFCKWCETLPYFKEICLNN